MKKYKKMMLFIIFLIKYKILFRFIIYTYKNVMIYDYERKWYFKIYKRLIFLYKIILFGHIASAFIWSKTKEGNAFWYNINTNWFNYRIKNNIL